MDKMLKKTNKIILGIICFLLASVTILAFGGTSAIAYAQTKDLDSKFACNMTAYDNYVLNERLLDLTKSHIKQNMGEDFLIEKTKTLYDFDGNKYTLFELSPTGYIIYHIDSGKFVEYSAESVSPYLNVSKNLYYGGAMQYYYGVKDTLQHTIKKDINFSASNISMLALDSRKMVKALNVNILESNIDYINGKCSNINIANIEGEVEKKEKSLSKTTSARIGMTSFFPNLKTASQIGYRDGGACGYIATNLVIGYNYFAFDYGLISNSSYVNFSNKTMNGSGLTDRLLVLNGENPNGGNFGGTTSNTMYNVMKDYMDEINNYESWKCSWYLLSPNTKSTLDDGYPVALFGSFDNPQASGSINHAVVAYDYGNYGLFNMYRKYRVHFGWTDYASVWLESPVVGSNFFMKIS
ncbi:MAG: hypothetical protein WCR54_05515 [Clostridia bacterium]